MNNRRTVNFRLSSGLLLLMLILSISTKIGEVASAPTMVQAGSISLYPGGTGSVAITVRDITAVGGLGAYDLRVTFNRGVVEVLDVLGGASPFDSVTAKNIDNSAGQVTFNSYIIATKGPTGTITVAYLKVRAVGSAGSTSSLGVTIISLVDAQTGEEIDPTTRKGVAGSVTISAPKSSSSMTLGLGRDEVRVDESVMVSGKISPAHAVSVTLTFTRPDETRLSKTTSSGSDGAYTYLFEPDMAGAWKVSASWLGDADHYGASSSTAKFLVTKLNSSISIQASPMVLEPGESLRIEGSVTPERDGAMTKLEYRLHEGEWTGVAEIVTNSTGRFLYDWDIELAPGQYELRASWLGDHIFEGSESSPFVFYVAEVSAVSISLSSHSVGLNGTVAVRGEVSPSHAYVDVTVSAEAPNGTGLALTTQTDAAGNYKMTFVPDAAGVWRFESSWQGDFNTHGSNSLPVELQVVSAGSSISLQSDVSSITKGSQVTFSGEIEPSPGTTTVILELTRPNSSLAIIETRCAADGTFSVEYAPDQAGVWLAQVSWLGNSDYGGATSLPVSFIVEKHLSSLSLSLDPPIPKKGDLVTFDGSLDPSISSGPVEVLVSNDEGETWGVIASLTTQSSGEYSASWRAHKLGTFFFRSVWKGDEEHAGCTSRVIKLVIQEGVVSARIPLADGYGVNVVSSTNSSTSALSVDSSDGKINVEVTGPNGTRGLMNIFIPDGLLDYYDRTINDVVFSVDGILVTPEIVEVAGGYLAAITYDHSERTISMHYLTHSIAIAVTDYEGTAIAGADTCLVGPVSTSGVTNGSGSMFFPNMPMGNYTIQVYYGGKVAEGSLELAEDKVLTISTVVGKIEAEYRELLEEYAVLQREHSQLQQDLATTQTAMYLSVIAFAVFTSVYFALKGQDQIHYVARRFSDFLDDVSGRLRFQRPRLRRRRKREKKG